MLSHDNVFSMVHCAGMSYLKSGGEIPDPSRCISYLPLSHIAGQTLSWYTFIYIYIYVTNNIFI